MTRFVTTGNVVGCDYAGIIEEFGSDVPETYRKVGARVAGFVHGGTYKLDLISMAFCYYDYAEKMEICP